MCIGCTADLRWEIPVAKPHQVVRGLTMTVFDVFRRFRPRDVAQRLAGSCGHESRIKHDSWNAFVSAVVPAVPAHSSSKRRAPQPKAREERELPARRAWLMWTNRPSLKSRGQQTTYSTPQTAYCCYMKCLYACMEETNWGENTSVGKESFAGNPA
jgi:hypothetical protein